MTLDEADRLTMKLAKLFPGQMTTDQRKSTIRGFQPFRVSTVEAAVAGHRQKFNFITYPKLYEACVAAEREADLRSHESVPAQSFADIARGQSPQLAAVKDDLEVIIRKHRGWWHKCSKSDAYRSNFGNSCKHQVYDVLISRSPRNAEGKVEDDVQVDVMAAAEAWANVIFEDAATFAMALEDLRGNLPGGHAA